MTTQLKSISLGLPLLRVVLIAPLAFAVVSSWYVVRWYVGGTMAEYAPNDAEGGLDTALSAASLAPDDPLTHFVVAELETATMSEEKLSDAVKQYEESARLSPNDYRLWMSLGQSLEAMGDTNGAEKSLRRALALAPSYAYPHWYLGNFLVREHRLEEAFAELQVAGDADPALRPQIFSIAWHSEHENVEWMKRTVGNSTEGRASLAGFLLDRGRVDAALQIWSEFSFSEKIEQGSSGESFMSSLIAAKHFQAALEFLRGIKGEGARVPEVGQIFNGSFENEPERFPPNAFDWQLRSNSAAQVAFDASNHRTGARSLRISFNARSKLDFNQVSQLVVVEPSTSYRLEFYVRSEKLTSADTPRVEVVDAIDGHSILGVSLPAQTGDSGWQSASAIFNASPKTEAVLVRIVRAGCAGEAGCPIYGIVWYDDFNLQRVRRNGSPA